jgi:septal ring factor EnvC (AmiA/AmiB activator)
VAELEENLFCVMERNAELQEENARLRAEVERFGKHNTRLRQEWAAARKDASTLPAQAGRPR